MCSDLHSLPRFKASLAPLWIVRNSSTSSSSQLLSPSLVNQTSKSPMAAAILTGSAIQFHLLVLGIAICFAIPVVHSGGRGDDTCQSYPVDSSVVVNAHNLLRSKVTPSSSNMRRMVC